MCVYSGSLCNRAEVDVAGEKFAALWSVCCKTPRPSTPEQLAEFGQTEFWQTYINPDASPMSLEQFLDPNLCIMDEVDPLMGV